MSCLSLRFCSLHHQCMVTGWMVGLYNDHTDTKNRCFHLSVCIFAHVCRWRCLFLPCMHLLVMYAVSHLTSTMHRLVLLGSCIAVTIAKTAESGWPVRTQRLRHRRRNASIAHDPIHINMISLLPATQSMQCSTRPGMVFLVEDRPRSMHAAKHAVNMSCGLPFLAALHFSTYKVC